MNLLINLLWEQLLLMVHLLESIYYTRKFIIKDISGNDPILTLLILISNLTNTITNSQLTNSAVTVTAGDGLSGGGSVSLGSSVSLAVQVDDSSLEINSDTLRVKASGVTNSMLAGSIANAKLSNSSITIAGASTALGGSITADTIANAISTADIKTSGDISANDPSFNVVDIAELTIPRR